MLARPCYVRIEVSVEVRVEVRVRVGVRIEDTVRASSAQ